jgi:AAA domain
MPSFANVLKNYMPGVVARRTPLGRGEPKKRSMPLELPTPLGLSEFLALEIPSRAKLLDPILPEKSLAMLYAPRGIGKSWLGLSIGLAVAGGDSLLRWKAPEPRRVLLVDGEMPLADLQGRLAFISIGLGRDIPPGGFQILAADQTETGINLASSEGQLALERHLEGIDLVILDNLSTLLASGSEGASDAWLPMQNWLLRLRRKGVAVLLIHHAGTNARQRGTSRREDALDTVIALRRPADYSAEEGARFEIHIEKARTVAGEGALPFEAAIEPFITPDGGLPGIRWVARDLKSPIFRQAAELFARGMSVREVRKALGISHGEAGPSAATGGGRGVGLLYLRRGRRELSVKLKPCGKVIVTKGRRPCLRNEQISSHFDSMPCGLIAPGKQRTAAPANSKNGPPRAFLSPRWMPVDRPPAFLKIASSPRRSFQTRTCAGGALRPVVRFCSCSSVRRAADKSDLPAAVSRQVGPCFC